jgi:hypothetical protein
MVPSVRRSNSEIVPNRLQNAAMTYDLYFSLTTTTPKKGQKDRRRGECPDFMEEKEGEKADKTS